MSGQTILIAGIGNIFLGDDAFGVEVVQRLVRRELPDEVRVVDFGIRGLDLAYALAAGYETAILVDAVGRGGPPGTLYVLEPETGMAESGNATVPPDLFEIEMHSLDPAKVLRLVRVLGGSLPRILLVGCEPKTPAADEEMVLELSAPVRAAVDRAVGLIESLVVRLIAAERQATTIEERSNHA